MGLNRLNEPLKDFHCKRNRISECRIVFKPEIIEVTSHLYDCFSADSTVIRDDNSEYFGR